MTSHSCSLSGSLDYAVFVDINETRNPATYKLLRRSSSYQFYQKRKKRIETCGSNITTNTAYSSIHSINEVDLESEFEPDGFPSFSPLITARNTFPKVESSTSYNHSFKTQDTGRTCAIPIQNRLKMNTNTANCCYEDYCEPLKISASVPNTSYRSD